MQPLLPPQQQKQAMCSSVAGFVTWILPPEVAYILQETPVTRKVCTLSTSLSKLAAGSLNGGYFFGSEQAKVQKGRVAEPWEFCSPFEAAELCGWPAGFAAARSIVCIAIVYCTANANPTCSLMCPLLQNPQRAGCLSAFLNGGKGWFRLTSIFLQ